MTIRKKVDAPALEEAVRQDDLDAQIDYDGIASRSEADRHAGRVLTREQVRARTDKKLADLRTRRRSA